MKELFIFIGEELYSGSGAGRPRPRSLDDDLTGYYVILEPFRLLQTDRPLITPARI